MGTVAFEIVIVLCLILFNGVFAMAELAVMTARKARLQQKADEGSGGAASALALKDEPDRFLSIVQIGITLIGVLSGAFAGATIAESLGGWLDNFPVLAGRGETLAVAVVVIILTFLSLVFGELVPKQIALNNPEAVASRIARPMATLSLVSRPFVWLLMVASSGVMRLLRIRPGDDTLVSEEEVKIILREGTEAGLFDEAERDIIERTFKLGDRTVRSLMTHRSDMIWLDSTLDLQENLDRMANSPHHYFPLGQGSVHEIIGVVPLKDVWRSDRTGGSINFEALARPPLYVIETTTGLRLLDLFRESHSSVAIVVDEHGSVEGIVTVNDLLEAVVGDLPSITTEPDVVEREDGSWLVEAVMAIEEFEDRFEFPARDVFPGSQIASVAGLVIAATGSMPKLGTSCRVGPYRIEVVDMDNHRIDKVLVTRLPMETLESTGE